MAAPDRACPDYPNECVHPLAHARTHAEVKATQADHTCCYHVAATKAVLAERERELLDLKGPCSNTRCRLHYAHSGPCDTKEHAPATAPTLGHAWGRTGRAG